MLPFRGPMCARRSLGCTALLALFFAASTSCDRPKTEKPVPNLTKVTVAQWGQERYLIYLPLYVAMEEGFFRDAGLDVTLVYTGNDDQTFAAVVSGSAQFGVGDPAFAAISNERGMPARVIATIVGGVAIWGIAKNDAVKPVTRPEDLAGLRIGTFPSPSTNYALMKALVESRPEALKATTIIQADIGAQIALLESNTADIAMVLEPAASRAEAQGYRVVYSSPRFHGPFTFTGITTTRDYLEKNGSIAESFVMALEKALRSSHKDPTLPVQVGKKLFPSLDATVVERAVTRMLDEKTYPEHAIVPEQAWQALLDVRLKVGDLKNMQSMPTTVDNSFADKARSGN